VTSAWCSLYWSLASRRCYVPAAHAKQVALFIALTAAAAVGGCASERERRLLHDTDYAALLSACRRAMASLPPPGPSVDPLVYTIDSADDRFQRMFSVLQARTVYFQAPADKPSVADSRLPPEILRLEPLFVAVSPDAVHIGLCGAGVVL
jgi:hypothetical protein